ncbi:MAG: sugar transporter, partial [Rikenellaceae bacterium]
KYSQLANIVRLLVQMAIAYYTRDYYLWIVMELIFAIIYSIILTRRVNKIYPFLRANIRDGKRLLKSYPELITKTKQLFVHSMAAVILGNLSPVILYAYTSAVMIAHYTNYTIITLKLGQLISHLFSSVDAAVGSVIAEGKGEMIQRVFWEISSLYYLIAGVIVITLYFLINPFIILFFGAEYVLPQLTVFIILFNFYLSITRTGNGLFISGYGLFYDTWAPVTEAIINVAVSVVGGIYFGINGVLFGTTLSVVLIVHIWKPYFLFKQGFKDRLSHYWLTITKYISAGVITFGIIFYLSDLVAFRAEESYFQWFTYACAVFVITSLVLGLLMYVSSRGLRDAVDRITNNLLKRI